VKAKPYDSVSLYATNFNLKNEVTAKIQLTSCKRFDNNCYHLCIAIVLCTEDDNSQLYRLLWL